MTPDYDYVAAEAGVSKRAVRAVAPTMEALAGDVRVIALTAGTTPSTIGVNPALPEELAALLTQILALTGMLGGRMADELRDAEARGDRKLTEIVKGLTRDTDALTQRAAKAEEDVARLRKAIAVIEKEKGRLADKCERLAGGLRKAKDENDLLRNILEQRDANGGRKARPEAKVDTAGIGDPTTTLAGMTVNAEPAIPSQPDGASTPEEEVFLSIPSDGEDDRDVTHRDDHDDINDEDLIDGSWDIADDAGP